ncbi:MAG: polysaccharide biosynthesis/export family protein [Alphaproteobacteria bacterium]
MFTETDRFLRATTPTRCLRLALVAAILLAAAAIPALAGPVTAEYRVGPGDRLNVAVFGQPDLSGEVQVNGSGRFSMPLIGQMPASGKTVSEVQSAIIKALDADYIISPRVTVEVVNYRPFYILGQVNRPGRYSYIEGMTVRMAVAIAGGFTRRAPEDTVIVFRANDPEQLPLSVSLGELLLPGDSIDVERRPF